MIILPNFLRSILLAMVLSFVSPSLFFGGVLVLISLLSYIPPLQASTQVLFEQILQFLATFGSGNPCHGIVVIGITCGLVGALFDIYAFYRYQSLR